MLLPQIVTHKYDLVKYSRCFGGMFHYLWRNLKQTRERCIVSRGKANSTPRNVSFKTDLSYGDIDNAFKECDNLREDRFETFAMRVFDLFLWIRYDAIQGKSLSA